MKLPERAVQAWSNTVAECTGLAADVEPGLELLLAMPACPMGTPLQPRLFNLRSGFWTACLGRQQTMDVLGPLLPMLKSEIDFQAPCFQLNLDLTTAAM